MTPTAYYVGNPIEQTSHKDRFGDNYLRDITIECRGERGKRIDEASEGKTWAVVYKWRTYTKTLSPAEERQPSSRTDRYLNDHRHTLKDAEEIAMRLLKRETKSIQKEWDMRYGTAPYKSWREED